MVHGKEAWDDARRLLGCIEMVTTRMAARLVHGAARTLTRHRPARCYAFVRSWAPHHCISSSLVYPLVCSLNSVVESRLEMAPRPLATSQSHSEEHPASRVDSEERASFATQHFAAQQKNICQAEKPGMKTQEPGLGPDARKWEAGVIEKSKGRGRCEVEEARGFSGWCLIDVRDAVNRRRQPGREADRWCGSRNGARGWPLPWR